MASAAVRVNSSGIFFPFAFFTRKRKTIEKNTNDQISCESESVSHTFSLLFFSFFCVLLHRTEIFSSLKQLLEAPASLKVSEKPI